MSNEEAVILKSPEPFESRYASGWFILSLFIIPFAIWGLGHILFDPESSLGVAFMVIGVGAVFVILILYKMNLRSAINHFAEMRNMKFKITNDATLEKIYNKIEPALRNIYGEKVKFLRKTNCVVVTFNGINYEIVLNNDATFSIHLQKSLLEKSIYIFAKIAEIFYDRDYNDDDAPTWNYEKIRTGMPIIAYELQRAFGVTSTSENKIQPTAARSIQEIYERAKLAANSPATENKPTAAQSIQEIYERAQLAANSPATENKPPAGQSIQEIYEKAKLAANSPTAESKLPVKQNLPQSNNRRSQNKKVFIVSFILIAVAGLMMMLVSYVDPTPDVVDKFVKRYNTEIKKTAGAIVQNKYNGMSYLVENCTLDNLLYTDRGKTQGLFSGKVFFYGWDKTLLRRYTDNSENQAIPLSVHFDFDSDVSADAVFAIIEASIAAAGDDEEKVAKRLGILNGNRYSVPYNYQSKITFNDKEYLISSSEGHIRFLITIPTK